MAFRRYCCLGCHGDEEDEPDSVPRNRTRVAVRRLFRLLSAGQLSVDRSCFVGKLTGRRIVALRGADLLID